MSEPPAQSVRLSIEEAMRLAAKLAGEGQAAAAEQLYRQVIQFAPASGEARYHLAGLVAAQQRTDEAIALGREAIRLRPDSVDYHLFLGKLLLDRRQTDEAVEIYRRVTTVDPQRVEGWNGLAFALSLQGFPTQALDCYQRSLNLRPGDFRLLNNVAMLLRDQGRLQEALATARQALALRPDLAELHSNYLFTAAYAGAFDSEVMLQESRIWYERFGAIPRPAAPAVVDRRPDRRLRVGYVSGDFRRHAAAAFIEPMLETHDRAAVEVFCYSNVPVEDRVTERMRGLADHFHAIAGHDDRTAAERIRSDAIDLLIDLSGHNVGNRLSLFTLKPAPIAATYLNYFATTGLPTIDYWITDGVLHPADTIERSVERIWRLPRCWASYRPDPACPDVEGPPSAHGALTFGSFNQLPKVTPSTVELWSSVLRALPESRLLLKAGGLQDPAERARLQQMFAAAGVASERLVVAPFTPSFAEHMSCYGAVDIALDPVPLTGATTTCDALWMGVPVLTLAGSTMIGRFSASYLTALGLTDWIAESPAEFVAKAVQFAADLPARRALRATQRQLMASSPVCDERGLTTALESAYREMWIASLDGGKAGDS